MIRDISFKPFRNQQRKVIVSKNPLVLTGTRFSNPMWITKGYNDDESKLYLFNLIGNPTAGWNEVKTIDVATNKLSTLTNVVDEMLYMDGGMSWRSSTEFVLTGRDWVAGANVLNSSRMRRLAYSGSWSCGNTDIPAPWAHTAAGYDPWCIKVLQHSKYNINGKQAILTGQYDNANTTQECGLRLHYWTGVSWTNLDLKSKTAERIDGAGTSTSVAYNGQTVSDIYEDANGRLFIVCGLFTASGCSGLYLLEPNTTGVGLTALSGWNFVIKLCGRTNSSGGGFADGTGNSALFRQQMRFIGVDYLNGNSNPVFIIADRGNHCIRRVDTQNCTSLSATVTTLAGLGGTSGFTDAVGTAARFSTPYNGVLITVDGVKWAIITDYGNHRLRKLNLSTMAVSTYGGDGIAGNINN